MEGQRFGRYRLERQIGSGGMGDVYEAADLDRDRLVALKLLPELFSNNDEFEQRFRRESRLAARQWVDLDGAAVVEDGLQRFLGSLGEHRAQQRVDAVGVGVQDEVAVGDVAVVARRQDQVAGALPGVQPEADLISS